MPACPRVRPLHSVHCYPLLPLFRDHERGRQRILSLDDTTAARTITAHDDTHLPVLPHRGEIIGQTPCCPREQIRASVHRMRSQGLHPSPSLHCLPGLHGGIRSPLCTIRGVHRGSEYPVLSPAHTLPSLAHRVVHYSLDSGGVQAVPPALFGLSADSRHMLTRRLPRAMLSWAYALLCWEWTPSV